MANKRSTKGGGRGKKRSASKGGRRKKVTIRKAGKKPLKFEEGGLHRALGVPEDKPIPAGKRQAALRGDYGPKAKTQATFAFKGALAAGRKTAAKKAGRSKKTRTARKSKPRSTRKTSRRKTSTRKTARRKR